jgi:hypothetical protein
MDPVKVAGVVEWPTLKSKKEVQQFVGFVKIHPGLLSHCLTPLEMGRRTTTSIQRNPTLSHIGTGLDTTNSDPFLIKANSSDFATGAVLSQYSEEDDKWHPVTFLSKSLSAMECNYEIHNKEMLATI